LFSRILLVDKQAVLIDNTKSVVEYLEIGMFVFRSILFVVI